MSKELIVKDNALVNASYNLDLIEQRLILLAIVEARRSNQEITPSEFLTIHISSYIDEFGIENKTKSVYDKVKEACKTLFERKFTYERITKKGNLEKVTSRWVQSIAYVDNEAIVRLKFSDDVTPLITNLERQFTKYNLEQVAGINSKYAVRLYEMLIAWQSQGKTPLIEIEELRNRLGVGNGEYKIMGDFKKRVLDLSIKEINEKTDIKATYEQHKQGKKIIGFTFKFQQTKKKKSEKENRDENTGDMFATLKMTDKQRSYFASKLSELHECSQLPYGNQSYEALAKWIEKDLLKPERIEFYRPLLKKVGFSE